jgi:quinohemoprotein ethanol dehydrogenase
MGWSASAEVESHKGIVIDGPTQKRRLLTFVLDGDAKLPPAPPPPVVKAFADSDYKPDAALAAKGGALFADHCAYCHGQMAIGAGYAPDLRTSGALQSFDTFKSIVTGGQMVSVGMPKWGDLSDHDLMALRQYIRDRAADLRAGK